MNALESLGCAVNGNMKMADLRSEVYFKIGLSILQNYADYNTKDPVDDTEYIAVVRVIIEAISQEMRSSGIEKRDCAEVAQKLKTFNRTLYQNIWIKHAKEDQEPDDKPFDLEKEYELAQYTFDYIYEHSEHPHNL